jgi:hypothetical protein
MVLTPLARGFAEYEEPLPRSEINTMSECPGGGGILSCRAGRQRIRIWECLGAELPPT